MLSRIREFTRLVFTGGTKYVHPVKEAIDEAPKKLFLTAISENNARRIAEGGLTESTAQKYGYFYSNIERYLISRKYSDLTCDKVDIGHFIDMRAWLQTPGNLKSCDQSHSSRHVEMCISAMDYAVLNRWATHNCLTSLPTGRKKRKEVLYLDPPELKKILTYDFQSVGYRKAQVLATFASATGISYGNLFDYKSHIDEETGGLWIEDNRKKVGKTPFFVPLDASGFELAKAIHLHYDGKLPKLENAVYNRYLKEMAAAVNIHKRITTHTMRKTFATLMAEDGFTLAWLEAVMGSSQEVIKDHYVSKVIAKKKVQREISDKEQGKMIQMTLAN